MSKLDVRRGMSSSRWCRTTKLNNAPLFRAGFAAFTAICVVQLTANLYANNVLNVQQSETFLLRAWECRIKAL